MDRLGQGLAPLVLLHALLLLLPPGSATCPERCSCRGDSVFCAGTNQNTIPDNLPPRTKFLYIQRNSIQLLPANGLANVSQLQVLNISENIISTIDKDAFSGLSKLEKLWLSSNNISVINAGVFAPLISLTELELSDNRLSVLDAESLGSLPALSHLFIEHNRAQLVLHPQTFTGLTSLTLLRLRSSGIANLVPGTFEGLQSLTALDLRSNQLGALRRGTFADLQSLLYLYLDSNDKLHLIEDETFTDLDSILHLNISECSLVSLSGDAFKGLKSLEEIFLSSNQLEAIQPKAFCTSPNLLVLDAGDNPLKYVDSESFSCLSKLRTLKLNGGKLTRIGEGVLSPLPELDIISLRDNNISEIADDAFRGKERLSKLELDSNRLETLNASLFLGVTNLHTLHLHDNLIETLSADTFNDVEVPLYLTLRGNPLVCDCGIDWIDPWMEKTRSEIDSCQCAEPPALHGRHVYSVHPKDFHCAPFQTGGPTDYVATAEDSDFSMACPVYAKPSPTIYWLTPDGERITDVTVHDLFSVDRNGSLIIRQINEELEGEFMCTATNALGHMSVEIVLNINQPTKHVKWVAIVVICAIVAVIAVVVVVGCSSGKVRRNCCYPRKMRHAWSARYDPLNAKLDAL